MTTIIGAVSASHISKKQNNRPPLTPAIPAILSSVVLVTVERKGTVVCHCLIPQKGHATALRRCLLSSVCSPEERATVEKLDIAPTLTNFRVGDLSVKAKKAMMMKSGDVTTWCAWTVDQEDTMQFWTSPPSVDLSDFVVALCPNAAATVHYEASLMVSEQGSWMRGIIEHSTSKRTGFYRISQRGITEWPATNLQTPA